MIPYFNHVYVIFPLDDIDQNYVLAWKGMLDDKKRFHIPLFEELDQTLLDGTCFIITNIVD